MSQRQRQPFEPELETPDDVVLGGGVDLETSEVTSGVATGFDFSSSTDLEDDEDNEDDETSIDLTACACVAPDLGVEKDDVGEWSVQVVYCDGCGHELATLTQDPDAVGCNNFPE